MNCSYMHVKVEYNQEGYEILLLLPLLLQLLLGYNCFVHLATLGVSVYLSSQLFAYLPEGKTFLKGVFILHSLNCSCTCTYYSIPL